MVIIDKSKDSVRLLFTLTEKTSITDANFLLVLYSPYDKTTQRFILPANTSPYQFRYDEFILNASIFKNLIAGNYYYSIYQSATESTDETIMGKPVETGLLKVVDIKADDFVSIEATEEADDFVVYGD